jgi:hypothetical protein
MRVLRTLAPVVCVVAVLVLGAAPSPRVSDPGSNSESNSDRHGLWASPDNLNYAYSPNLTRRPGLRSAEAAAVTSTFQVTYDAGFDANPAAKAAFQAAVDLWSQILVSPASIPIKVNAEFKVLSSPGLLGSAGPTVICGSSAGIPNTFYAAALANKLNNSTSCVSGSGFHILARFNSSNANWEFGTNGVPVAGKYNFLTVVMHELAHGLGFYGSMTSSGGIGSFGYGSQGFPGFVDVYDRFAVSGAGTALISLANPSASLHNQLVSNNTFFNGSNTVSSNGGVAAKLETHSFSGGDNGWVEGSSFRISTTFFIPEQQTG